jgi:hypothetical protein
MNTREAYSDLEPEIKMKLRNILTQRGLRSTGNPLSGIAVRPSAFGGKGVFVTRDAPKGTHICTFRGAAHTRDSVTSARPKTQDAFSRYMICAADGSCNVPLAPNRSTPPSKLPSHLSACFMNESCSTPQGEYPPNVVIKQTGDKSDEMCPYMKSKYFDWAAVTSRKVHAGEELLLCYGPGYGERKGYKVSSCCDDNFH